MVDVRPGKVTRDNDHDRPTESMLDRAEEADVGELTRVLDAAPGAWNRAELGRIQGSAGQTTSLDRL